VSPDPDELDAIRARMQPAEEERRVASALMESRRYSEASDHFRQALRKLPSGSDFDGLRMRILWDLGTTADDPMEGVHSYQAALRLMDDRHVPEQERARLLVGLGARLRNAERCEESIRFLEQGFELVEPLPDDAKLELLLNLGNANRDCGDLYRARSLYERVLVVSGDPLLDGAVLYGLASVSLLEGHVHEALSVVELSLRETEKGLGPEHPSSIMAVHLRACSLRALGQDPLAAESSGLADRILRENPAWFARGGTLHLCPRLVDACGGIGSVDIQRTCQSSP
jgi:tetratricopeptide (TPR) repeat protein